MPRYGQITSTIPGESGSWLVEVDANGWPIGEDEDDIVYVPVAKLPGAIPVWSIALPIEGGFSDDQIGEIALMMRGRAAERRDADPVA